MSEVVKPGVAADALQADYFKGFLALERSESESRLAALTRRLTECVVADDRRHIGYLRGLIRGAESELKGIDRMIDALTGRFPEAGHSRS
jgi:hypothetical protein